MKIDISKIFILDTTPNSTLPNRFWYDTVNNQLKRYDSTTSTWRLTNTTPDNVVLTVGGNQMTLTTYLNALYNQVSETQTNISTLSGDLISGLDKKVDWNILESNEIILKQGCDMAQQAHSPENICSIDLAKPYSYCFNYRMNFKSGGYGDTIFGNYNSTAGWKIFYSVEVGTAGEYVYNVYFEYVDQDSSKSISSTLIDFPCTDDELHTLVVAYTGSEFKIYIDGTLKNTFATTATSYNVNPIIFRMGDYYTERNLKNIYVFNFDITDASAPYTLTDYLNGNVIPTNLLGGTFYTTKPSMGLDNTSDWNITSALTVDRQQGGWLCKAGVAYCKQRSVADLPTGVEQALDLNTTTSTSYYISDTVDKIDHLANKKARVKISFWARKNSTDKTNNTRLYIYAGSSSLYSVSGSMAKDNNWHKYETTNTVSISSYNINRGIYIRAYAKANTFTDYAWSIADLHVELIGAAVALENYVYREDVDYYTNCPLLKDTSANGNNYYYYDSGGDYADNSILVDHPEIKPDLIKLIDINSFLPKNYSEDNSNGNRMSKINGSLAEGYETVVNNDNSSHAEGYGTQATGYNGAHAEGYATIASGDYSHAEGYVTQASRDASHAEGYNTQATAHYSHAEGNYTQATGYASHAEGNYTQATGYASHAEGNNTIASGDSSHAEGYYTQAASEYQHVQGKYNVVDSNNIYADIIGGGTSTTDLKNIYTVDWNGNVVAEGDVSGKVDGNVVSLSSLSADISTKATDSAVVHLADEETITGTKTFENCDLNIANGLLTIDGINVLSSIQTNSTNIESLSSNKADDNKVVHLAGAETITGSKTFNDGSSYSTTVHSSGVSITGSGYTTSLDYQGINFNEGRLEGILSDFTSRSSTTVVNSQATYNALLLKQDKEDNSLTTDSKVIVSAINELNAKLLVTMPDPITASYTFTSTTEFTSFITNSSYANIQGKLLISPNINNLGAIYVGQSVSNKTNAFPLYPNQIVSLSFTDITNFKCAADVSGDSFNYVIEFGILNAAVTPANGLVVLGTNGSQYRLDPTGDAGSETFTLTKIS